MKSFLNVYPVLKIGKKMNEGAMNEQGRRSGWVGVGYSPQNRLYFSLT